MLIAVDQLPGYRRHVSVCAILLGSILAWLMVRSDLPFKKFFSLAVIIPT